MPRPLFRTSIVELEKAFAERRCEKAFLAVLAEELRHRSTDRAKVLQELVAKELAGFSRTTPVQTEPQRSIIASPQAAISRQPGPAPDESEIDNGNKSRDRARDQSPLPQVTNSPENILSAWTALEVLSPPLFRKPQDLAGGDASAVAFLKEHELPWERGERSRPNCRLYYQIVLGSINTAKAIESLIERYGDSGIELPPAKGDAILAVVIADKRGCLVESSAVTVSSFGWGVMTALKDDLRDLARWPLVEMELVRDVERDLLSFASDAEEEEKRKVPLTRDALLSAYQALLRQTGLPEEMVEPPTFAIRTYEYFKNSNPPEPLLLNSFFLGDLGRGRALFANDEAPDNLKRYLGVMVPEKRANLLRERKALEAAIAPHITPLSRWPGPGRHSLALLQQAAVNLAFSETRNGGIIGVNGPPGTGKTTLLRDILAGVVTERAQVMCQFDDPETAFKHSGEKLKAGNAWLHLYELDEKLRGQEMVVASSNNKAVENVSRELPAISSIATDADELRYFKVLADELHGRDTWGMVAAVLGNASNRGNFKQTFWWNEDVSLNAYLSAAVGSTPQVAMSESTGGQTEFRPPKIVTDETPPHDHEDALARWKVARKRFEAALDKTQKWQAWLGSIRDELRKLDTLVEVERDARLARDGSLLAVQSALSVQNTVEQHRVDAHSHLSQCESELAKHGACSPGFWARLFRTSIARAWSGRRDVLRAYAKEARAHFVASENELNRALEAVRIAQDANAAAEAQLNSAMAALSATREKLKEAREKYGVVLPDDEFFAQEHSQKHQTTVWYPAKAQRDREELFTAAIHLHRAFIDAAARPLRHNLSALMNMFSGGSFPSAGKEALLPHLWSTLFLVVPLVSTTFASVGKMFGRLPPESLGWLLVDEAGQALPQAAVGAIIRSRRVIVVGDPAQVEPVVMLPDQLTSAIARSFGVDPDTYTAPTASVQTLADSASPFSSEFQTKVGSRTVGVPLLVHRRCSEPMFSVSNAIAYSGLMVQAKTPKESPIRKTLGPSRWIHVMGSGEDKWCPEEGAEVIRLLRRLVQSGIEPNIYIVTPFVIVAERLRHLIRESRVFVGVLPEGEIWSWVAERVGTIHTVQGREAEAVIFVLGAPRDTQTGARNWAGGRPNLLNVAVTRAQEVLYVIGNRELWREAGHFQELDAFLDRD